MNQSGVLITIFCLSCFHAIQAQNTTTSQASDVLKPLHPSIAIVIGILSIMLTITFIVLAYAKFCRTNYVEFSGQNTVHQDFQGLILSRSRSSGIDKTVIDSLPFFTFSSLKGAKQGLECAVCISKFESSEILRLLPKCRHAFHKSCIDQWLESHASCPLCRHKFDAIDLQSLPSSNSLRFCQSPSNLTEDPNLELFVQREQDYRPVSSRFIDIGSSYRSNNIDDVKKEKILIQEGIKSNNSGDRKLFHKFNHKIIVSDVVIKNRWSDVNSSDMLFLNSEMLNAMSSNRFSPTNPNASGLGLNEDVEKIKEDIERKRLYESKISTVDRSSSLSASSLSRKLNEEETSSNTINSAEKRSMSEIINFSRFRNLRIKDSASPKNDGREEMIRRLWLPIARRTVQWFVGREGNLQDLAYRRQESNV